MGFISIIISLFAILISGFGLWENYLKPFELYSINSKIVSYMGENENVLLFDLYISFSNLGKKFGLIKDIEIKYKNNKNIIRGNVISECKLQSDGQYKKDKDWHPILLRGEESKLAMFVIKATFEINKLRDEKNKGDIIIKYIPNLKEKTIESYIIPFEYEINLRDTKLRNTAYREKINNNS